MRVGIRRGYGFAWALRAFWQEHKVYILCLGILALICCLTGVFSALKQEPMETIIDFALLKLCRNEFGFIGFLLCRILILGGLLFLICFLRHKFWGLLIYPILCVVSFCFGFDMALISLIFGIGATIGIIFGIFVCQVAYLLLFIIICSYTLCKRRSIARFGNLCHEKPFVPFLICGGVCFALAVVQGVIVAILF